MEFQGIWKLEVVNSCQTRNTAPVNTLRKALVSRQVQLLKCSLIFIVHCIVVTIRSEMIDSLYCHKKKRFCGALP